MKKFKKFFAVLLSLAMVMAMSMTAFAVDTPANGSANDTTTVSISGLEEGVKVTLYQIASGNYGSSQGAGSFKDYTWVTGINDEFIEAAKGTKDKEENLKSGLNSTQVNAVAQGILDGSVSGIVIENEKEVLGGTYTKEVKAGAYIAIIKGGKSVYNPVFLTATYDGDGGFNGGSIDLSDPNQKLYGSDAVAKKSDPKPVKEITGGGETENITENGENKEIRTGAVGDVIDFSVTLTMPSYPSNATNKTLFVTDEMEPGLTFDYPSLKIKLNGTDEDAIELDRTTTPHQFAGADGTVYATAMLSEAGNGFNINFNYDNLPAGAAPVVIYRAVINENAEVGSIGNKNDVVMYYAPNPNQGSTHETPNKPSEDEANDLVEERDQKIVYTYQVAFEKNDESGQPLEGAVFGIYEAGTAGANGTVEGTAIDIVETNKNGIAVSTNLAHKKYYIKELKAPAGYSLNETVYEIEPTWSTCTIETTKTITDKTYTTDPNKALENHKEQAGWLKGGKFFELSAYTEENLEAEENEKVYKAYLSSESTTKAEESTTLNNKVGGGTIKLGDAIVNTKLASLPSTGGIGTTIFTIGGCIIMIVAAGLFFASRRKSSAK